MCVGTAAAGIVAGALSIGSTVAGFIGAQQQAEQQAAYQGRLAQARAEQMRQNNENVINAYHRNLEQVQARQQQETTAAGQQAQAYQRENLARRGQARVATGESGASGVSLDILMAEFDRTQAGFTSSLALQQDMRDQSVFYQTSAMQLQAKGRAESIQPYIPTPVNGPSIFGAAMGIGSGAMYGYDRHQFYNGLGPYNPAGPAPSAQATAMGKVSQATSGIQSSLMGGLF